MAFRPDLSVDWSVSPRIITVASPSTELTIKDLYDTMRTLEASVSGMDEPHIIDGSGREPLGGGVYVGYTMSLQNAKIAFQARPGPTWVGCSIAGGNLVAFDTNGDSIDPVYATSFVQVQRVSSSSATLQELADIQFSSFNSGVTVKNGSPYSGTTYPIGTPRQPVNNLADAMTIATARGFSTISILGDLTIDAGGNYVGMSFIGDSKNKSDIVVTSDSNVLECEFYDMRITGVLDGDCVLKDCSIHDLQYISGYIEKCVLEPGTITLGGVETAHFLDCYSGVPGVTTPTIDMAGDGPPLAMRNYAGGIKLANKTGTASVSIDLNSGQVILDNTVTAGTIVIRGVGKVIDNSAGATVDLSGMMEAADLQRAAKSLTMPQFLALK